VIAGVDEAGRGPLAGPVYAAAVILDPARPIVGLADSKQLSEKTRERLAVEIRERACCWAIASSSVEEIDRLNILQASLLAMQRAVEALSVVPEEILVDGIYCPKVAMRARAIIKGDACEPAISAASILAKTARDAELRRLDALYPHYGLAQHKGYPTAAHVAALRAHGVIDIYRRSFKTVSRLLADDQNTAT
jgi:ribonuclease HII